MKYEIRDNVLVIAIENPKVNDGWQYSRLNIPSSLSHDRLEAIVETFTHLCNGMAIKSQSSLVGAAISSLLKFISIKDIDLPHRANDSEWTLFLVNFFIFYLTDNNWSNSSLSTRINRWRSLIPFLNLLKEQSLIPLHVSVPKLVNKKQQVVFEKTKQHVVGEAKVTKMKRSKQYLEDVEVNKLILDLSYAKDSDTFLDDIELDLRSRISGIEEICLEHWESVKAAHQKGRQLIDSIPAGQLENALSLNQFKYKQPNSYRGRKVYLTSPANEDGVAWSLAFLWHMLSNTNKPDAISRTQIPKYPFFASSDFDKNIPQIAKKLRSSEKNQELYSINIVHRHLGLLHVTDCAAACVLLTIEHPQFNSEALQECKLLSVNGNYHLIATDERDTQIFSVDKPRANCRKRVVLTPRAKGIVNYIIKCTDPIRKILKEKGDPTWRYLFLVSSEGILKASSNSVIARALNEPICLSLFRFYRESFDRISITNDSLTLSRIRNTMGVLEWFKTGQLRDMSRKLGNSERVCLENYIPPWLLKKWNEHLVRRFQQTLILLAAHDEPFLLEASDFTSVSDLVTFITQLVITNKKGNDPVADAIHERLFPFSNMQDNGVMLDGELGINLSANSLCALYAFSDWAKTTLSIGELNHKDALTGFAPVTLIHLSTLLRHVVAELPYSSTDYAIRTKVQGDSLKNLQSIHNEALVLLPGFTERFNSFSLSSARSTL